jgi:PRTRC genetic system protein C
MNVKKLEREFVFNGKTLPDPGPHMSVEQVREMYIPAHPEITTAKVIGPEPVDGKMRYTFSREIGAKG